MGFCESHARYGYIFEKFIGRKMATYVIGDVHGCFDSLQALLKMLNFRPKQDSLWFAGDLVNRGPKSLETLRFICDLP